MKREVIPKTLLQRILLKHGTTVFTFLQFSCATGFFALYYLECRLHYDSEFRWKLYNKDKFLLNWIYYIPLEFMVSEQYWRRNKDLKAWVAQGKLDKKVLDKALSVSDK